MGYLREAMPEDVDLLYEWANEETVRKNSFHMETIPYQEHQAWFRQMLARKDGKQYIFVCDEEPVGQVRIMICDDAAEVSYSIAQEKRCKGYARHMLVLDLSESMKEAAYGKYILYGE